MEILPDNYQIHMNTRQGFLKRSLLIPGIIAGVLLLFAIFVAVRASSNGSNTLSPNGSQKLDVGKPKAQQTLNKLFEFPLRDDKGLEVSKLKFMLENAQLQDEIIVKGQRFTAVKGRTFLILNMKITNDYDKPVSINTRDYIRLTVNNSKELLAPDVHNDPVEIQPISTKYTRLGFPINDSDKNLVLHVGEVTGKKEDIKLNLQ